MGNTDCCQSKFANDQVVDTEGYKKSHRFESSILGQFDPYAGQVWSELPPLKKWPTSPRHFSILSPLIPFKDEDEESLKIKNRLLLKRQVLKLAIHTGVLDNEKTQTQSTRKSTNNSQDHCSPQIRELGGLPYLQQVISSRQTSNVSETNSNICSKHHQKQSKPSLVKVQSQFNRLQEEYIVSSDSEEELKNIQKSARQLNIQQSSCQDKESLQVQMTQEQETYELVEELDLSNLSEESISHGQSQDSEASPALQRRSEMIKGLNKAIINRSSTKMLRRSSSFALYLDEKKGGQSPLRKMFSKDDLKRAFLLQENQPQDMFQLLVNMTQVK